MSLKDTDTYELLDRFDYLLSQYVPLSSELADKLDKFGKFRNELQLIVVELQERGVAVNEPEALQQLVKTAIEKQNEKATTP